MRIAIYGAGGVGGYFGARLAQAGEDVTFIARGAHLRAIQTAGLKVESLDGDFIVQLAKATDDVGIVRNVDLVIIGVKAWQVPEVARALKSLLPENAVAIPLQNGVDAVPQLVSELGKGRVIGGLCKIVSFVVAPGHIRHAGFSPSVVIGELHNQTTERVIEIAATFNRAGIETKIAADIDVALWLKFLFIASFSGVGAIADAPAGVLRSDPTLRTQMIGAMQEIDELARARGINLPADAVDRTLASVDALPAEATSSMQRDIAAGRPSEIESQNGAVVRMAREAGIKVPIHESIYQRLKARTGA